MTYLIKIGETPKTSWFKNYTKTTPLRHNHIHLIYAYIGNIVLVKFCVEV